MKTRKTISPRFAICVNNLRYPASLEVHKIYRVLPDKDAEEDGDLRVVDPYRESPALVIAPALKEGKVVYAA